MLIPEKYLRAVMYGHDAVCNGNVCVCLIAHRHIQGCLRQSSQQNRETPSRRTENTKSITSVLKQPLI